MGQHPWDVASQRVREQAQADLARQRSLLSPFLSGGSYSPENILSLWNRVSPGVAQVRTPGASAGDPYGLLASRRATDLASSSAAIQAGNAAQSLGQGMNPAARIAALSQIARSAAGNVGQIGANAYTQAYGQGHGVQMQGALSNQDAMNQARMGALGLFGQSLGQTYGMSQAELQRIYDSIQREKDRKAQEDAQNQQALGGAFGSVVGVLPALLGASSSGPVFNPASVAQNIVPWEPIDYGR